MRNFQRPGRSPVRVTEAAAATSHPLATSAALKILRAGGNAIDAAVAAGAVLAVVEPQSTGIGGDGFMLYAPKGSAKIIGFNGSGKAPQKADVKWFQSQGITSIGGHSPHSVTIPGLIDMWAQVLSDHGTMELGRVLEDAIHYAEAGYVIADRVAFDWNRETATISHDANSARVFSPVINAGDVHRQPVLAQTLKAVAQHGRDAFYKGALAEDMVQHLNALGGLHSVEDFVAAKGEYVAPISTSYRGHEIHQIPPNNQGLTALVMLNLLESFDLTKLAALSPERLHLEIEAGRLAYYIRDQFIGDPRQADIKTAELLSKDFAASLRKRINTATAMTDIKPIKLEKSDTVYLTIVDRDRNAVSFINSVYHSFGSGIMSPKTGVLLQNRGMGFKIDPAHPNCIAPGKRPLHTIMPGFVTRNGKALMPYGVMGGDYQPFGHVHLLQNIFDFGMDPQAALDAPRVFASAGAVEAEDGIASSTRSALSSMGHKVVQAPEPLGGGQAILIDWDKGTLTAGSEPRKDGCALGY
ncbi:gamma-glutamyltransferase [Aestuariivirga litoralis]|uniref:gamma-glutamyltransferase n=1 Tax=Aestuariivirga litoralis TaxID=2650924 RepID=UPI0018C66816|nr:gamma-glutamyltransferase [Aestuariivirga litoralis]MBG1233354.1 gamma-glutamyltransferase [Aestuariivirga litoralis]